MEELDGFPVKKNPTSQFVVREMRNKFTGFSYHKERKQPWAAWYRGSIVFFSADPEEVKAMLRRSMPKYGPRVIGQNGAGKS